MSPEYGATCGIFPVDRETLRYLEFTGRPPELVALVEAYMQGAGALPRPSARGADLLRHARARPRRRGAEPRRAAAAPGPGAARATPRARSSTRCRAPSDGGGRPETSFATGPRRGVAETFPASDPPAAARRSPTARHPGPRRRRRGRAQRTASSHARGRHRDRARPRLRRDRGHHELHQHLEPVGDARRRPAGQEGGRAGPRRASRG